MAKKKRSRKVVKKSKKVKTKSRKNKVVKKSSKKTRSKAKKSKYVKVNSRPLSQKFFFVGLVGFIISVWWTVFGLGSKPLALPWGTVLILMFLIMIVASFKSLEIS